MEETDVMERSCAVERGKDRHQHIPHSLMTDSYGRMTDGPFCCWCRLRPKDLPAGAHFAIAGTTLFSSFDRYEERGGTFRVLGNTIPLNGYWLKLLWKVKLQVL